MLHPDHHWDTVGGCFRGVTNPTGWPCEILFFCIGLGQSTKVADGLSDPAYPYQGRISACPPAVRRNMPGRPAGERDGKHSIYGR